MGKIDIYGELSQSNISSGDVVESQSTNKYLINIDCDAGLTLMECILRVKKVIDDIPQNSEITIYVVKGNIEKTSFDWKLFFEYLADTTRNYNIVYRGYIVDIAFLMAFKLDFITVYLPESNDAIPMLKHHGYKFELI